MTRAFSLFKNNPHAPPRVGAAQVCGSVNNVALRKRNPAELIRRVSPQTGPEMPIGLGSRLHSMNNLIKHAPGHGSKPSTANAAMLTCRDFRNEKCADFL
jgi:hypothetical protein